jgi:hypothetical protein
MSQLEAEVAELRAMVATPTPKRWRRPRIARKFLVLGLALALLIPAGVFAGTQTFTDVPPSHQFFNAIEEVAAAGVTSGCGDGTKYCPSGLVTRGQMAAFMSRLGALGSGRPPVVNAKTSQSTDGWSFGCPANTTYSQGKCFENTLRTSVSDIYAASDACATIGTALPLLGGYRWHLPSANELLSAARVTSLNLTATPEWTSDMYIEDDDGWSGLKVFNFIGADISIQASGNDDGPFRCATYPMAWDGISLIIFGGDPGLGSAPDSAAATEAQLDYLTR